ncbi:MAG: riboflavin synthase subunit alpha [Gammaproteobacteria bacterium]|nr:riboflavin synthase subunit alpha [Gammaproteobacteria bacterium]
MFTGIAHGAYRVSKVVRADGVQEFSVQLADYGQDLEIGASVALNGVCLTVVAVADDETKFEVGSETARITNLGRLRGGGFVNVERSLRFGDEIGGHLLSGHIATMAETCRMARSGADMQLQFLVPNPWRPYVMAKGFIALNGCSLTVAEYDRQSGIGSVNLIPETMRRTNFPAIQRGDPLNLEVDSHTQTIVETVRLALSDPAWLESVR